MKKLLSLSLAAVLLLCTALPCLAVSPASHLRFGSDGKFTIMQIADTQDCATPNGAMITFLNDALDEIQPDLVVFTGDNTCGGGCAGEEATFSAISKMLEPIVSRGIYFTVTFGNHDHESGVPKERQLEMYQSFPGCLAYDAVPSLTGCANHNLTIASSDGSKTAFNLWLIDSNEYDSAYNNEEYDYVHQDQLDWYKSTSTALAAQSGGRVPSLAFQHIIVPEIYDFMYWAPFETKISPKFNGAARLPLIKLSNYFSGRFDGSIMEFPCPPKTNSGEFDAWKEQGDVIAAFFGHDHVNDFVAELDGIDLVQTPSCTFYSYANFYSRGVRVIELEEDEPWDYETEVYRFVDAYGYGPEAYELAAQYANSEDAPAFERTANFLRLTEKIGVLPLIERLLESVVTFIYE